jgi:hypothetical protein
VAFGAQRPPNPVRCPSTFASGRVVEVPQGARPRVELPYRRPRAGRKSVSVLLGRAPVGHQFAYGPCPGRRETVARAQERQASSESAAGRRVHPAMVEVPARKRSRVASGRSLESTPRGWLPVLFRSSAFGDEFVGHAGSQDCAALAPDSERAASRQRRHPQFAVPGLVEVPARPRSRVAEPRIHLRQGDHQMSCVRGSASLGYQLPGHALSQRCCAVASHQERAADSEGRDSLYGKARLVGLCQRARLAYSHLASHGRKKWLSGVLWA